MVEVKGEVVKPFEGVKEAFRENFEKSKEIISSTYTQRSRTVKLMSRKSTLLGIYLTLAKPTTKFFP